MSEGIQFTEEEQAYIDMESGKAPLPEPVKTLIEEPVAEVVPPVEEGKQEESVEAKKEEKVVKPVEEEQQQIRKTAREKIRELRDEKKTLSKENEELKRDGIERLRVIEERLARESVPDPDMDPDAHREYQDNRIKELEAVDAEQKKADTERAKKDAEYSELKSFVEDQEADYIEEHNDYPDAIQWGKQEYARRLMDELDLSQEDAEWEVNARIETVARQVREIKGAKVPHYLYQQAKAMGWGKTEVKTTEESTVKTDDLKAISEGQKAARNPKGGGGDNKGGLTLEELSSRDDLEFHKIAGDMNALRKLFGE